MLIWQYHEETSGLTGHCPEERVHAGRLLAEKVPCTVMRGRRLRNFAIRLRLNSMDQIWKLDRILDEENWDVVSNDICDPSV
jgi:hypothetical protein